MQYISVMAIGKPGGCKSTAIAQILYAFARYGVTPELVSDRLLLEAAVVEDTKNGIRRPDGAIEGTHSILFDGTKPPGLKVFEVKDGTLLNRVHDFMVAYAGTHRNPHGVLLEFATGPDVPLPIEPLLQSGESFVERFRRNRILPDHHVVVTEIEASLGERRRRNGRRVDGMKEETFLKYFPDGGELRESGQRLSEFGVQFVWINNDHDDLSRFLRDTREFCDIHLRPLIEGNLVHIEGIGPTSERPFASTMAQDRR